ncbi:hypothetical protein BgiMline_022180 [Biomphalaria glabrata]|uniref:Uncharacterized protein n=1 Tax=Biomphalaria glabrata TaxID=6526 RepID=A0A2C9LMF7_BIOGL|nr:hypothetical protein BgiMline_010060 [Biomphalaria glabrata]
MTSPKKITAAKTEGTKKSLVQNAVCVAEKNLRNSPVFISLIIFTALLFFAVLFFNLLAGDPSLSKGLFIHGIANISNQFPLNITPAGWAFSIWGLIYLNQFAWVLYNLALICRSTPNGPAYLNPIILSPAFLIFFSLSSAFNIGWLFLWDRILFMASFVFSACIALSLFLTLAIASVRLVMFKDNLVDQGRKNEVTFLQIAVVNGIGMYATWASIATLINLAVVLVYKWSHPILNENASVISLGILTFLIIVYIGLDMTVLDQYTRYTYSPYVTVVWALSAIIAKNYDQSNISSIMAVVLLGSVSLAGLIKVALTCYRSRRINYQYRQMRRGRPANTDN